MLNWKIRPTRLHAVVLLSAAAVLAVSASPAGSTTMVDPEGNNIDVLYAFQGDNGDSGFPFVGVTADKQGNIYGAAAGTDGQGCNTDYGTVYELAANGSLKLLHQFNDQDATYPLGTVILDKSGNVWGTTPLGPQGFSGAGIVYKITPDGTFTNMHSFSYGTADGATPYAGLVMDKRGNFYGTTAGGGAYGWGTVFKITPKGKETVLYSFSDGSDGAEPRATLVMDASGNLYGTTEYGGINTTGCTGSGCGTVFKLAPGGIETTLYQFTGGNDGGFPQAGVILDSSGNIYGTASYGGADSYGTVFKVATDGTESTLYTFTGNADGAIPLDPLVLEGNYLYGTTECGGVAWGCSGNGVVFKLSLNGVEKPLYEFQNRGDGWNPFGGLTSYKGYLYGTTPYGGDKVNCHEWNGLGVIFRVKE